MNKKLRLLAFCLAIVSVSNTTAQGIFSYDLTKVVEDVYILKPTISDYRWVTANIIVIVNEKDVFVVDSGLLPSAGDEAIKEIKKITNKPVKYLLNTHFHGDHWQGNESFVKAYPDIELIASAEGYNTIMKNGMLWVKQLYTRYFKLQIDEYERIASTGKYADDSKAPDEEVKHVKKVLPEFKKDLEEIKTMKAVPPTMTFTDKMVIKRGDREIQLCYLGWGNTSGDAIVYLPKEKILITGDIIVSPSPFESGSFSKEWLDILKKFDAEYDYNYLLPGHGEIQTNKDYVQFLIALFTEIIRQTQAAWLETGKSKADDIMGIVTHKSVISVLEKEPRYSQFIKNLDPGFVAAAVKTGYPKVREMKL